MISEFERSINAVTEEKEQSRYTFAPELTWFTMFYNEVEPCERDNELEVLRYYVANLTRESCKLVEEKAELQLRVIELERKLAKKPIIKTPGAYDCGHKYTFNL